MVKAKFVDFKSKKLEFQRNNMDCLVDTLKVSNMTVDIRCFIDRKFIKNDNIPFAQLPKELKRIVNSK